MKDVDFTIRESLDPIADDQFVQRWSPRSMQKVEIPTTELEKMVDAARWAPSCFNDQPWHFILSTPKTFDSFLHLLLEGNQGWAQHASCIGFVLARKNLTQTGDPNPFAEFDAGAAWMSFVLQAYKLGYVMHGLGGIKKDEVYTSLSVPRDTHEVICGFVIGKRAPKENLPENLQKREIPSVRKKRKEILSWDQF